MTTDWILIRRAAAELERTLAGSRPTDAGLLDDGRVGFVFGSKRGTRTLAIDAFGSPPVVSLEDAELAIAIERGWLRSASTTLRGTRLLSVGSRPGDRVLVLGFGAASRFGVESSSQLVIELVPRYGNVVLIRERVVVAAAKQFSPAENETRSVQVGLPYEPPPLQQPALDRAAFAAALDVARDATARARALGGYLPSLPRLLAASLVAEHPEFAALPAQRQADALEAAAHALLTEAEHAAAEPGTLFAYRDDAGLLVATHLVPLAQYAGLRLERVPLLLDLFAEQRTATLRARSGDAVERRRATLLGRIAKRLQATDGELASVAARIADAAARDRLRRSGDALFTHVHEVPSGASVYVPPSDPELTIELDPELTAKDNAQRYFARYRKAADALPHLERRHETLATRRGALDVLAFEAERADAPTIPELEADLDALEGRPAQRAATPNARRRPPLRVEQPSGARIYVGRSPRENVEVTFRIARPDDLWFHARGIPGSHVVLQAPSGSAPSDDDLDAAANLAATHSKGRSASRVDIDYTERKHVRKQRDGAPGLVWYTDARTRIGRPANAP
jgi:predicted ribosome quality control (RQC) complex YloA/Tae2 family protein